MPQAAPASEPREIQETIESLTWYHTVDLGNGIVTPGFYDHRPYLACYGLPTDLTGVTALDIGAASGFFSFEMEQRGAAVTATDLPTWTAHDFGPLYKPDMDPEQADRYLHAPFLFAHQVRGSRVKRQLINIYEIGPQTVGEFDLVFCASVLPHLTDPARALWHIQSVTRQVAIIAATVHPLNSAEPLALFVGQQRGDGWWLPNRAALEAMVQSAGFKGWETFCGFRLDYRDGRPGSYHITIRAWNTETRPTLLDRTDRPAAGPAEWLVIRRPDVQRAGALARLARRASAIPLLGRLVPYGQRLAARLRGRAKT